jgi:hypothetical protein
MDATVISRYAGIGGAAASVAAEPQRDLSHAKSAAPQVMADALAHDPIRRPAFRRQFPLYFGRRNPIQQAD